MVKIQLSYQNQHSQIRLSWDRTGALVQEAIGTYNTTMIIIISTNNININSIILNTTDHHHQAKVMQLAQTTAVNCNAVLLFCNTCHSTVSRGDEKPITVLSHILVNMMGLVLMIVMLKGC